MGKCSGQFVVARVGNRIRKSKGIYVLTFFFFSIALSGFAQTKKYLILLKDKTGTPYTVEKPQDFLSQRSIFRRAKQGIKITQRDLPVNPTYVASIKQAGAKIWYSSRWLNAVMIDATTTVLENVKKLSAVKGVESNIALNIYTGPRVEKFSGAKSIDEPVVLNTLETQADVTYGISADQVKMLTVDKMHAQGFRGEGMLIGVLDNGFINANKLSFFQHLYKENRVLATYDFVNNETNVYNQGSHGTAVLSTMAAFKDSLLIGTAYKASYVLLHTEDDSGETRTEEANWLFAAEYADSVGVDVINSSLGYYNFDNAATDYTYADMNGNKTLITRAADWAVGTGMVVVVSAGNEGSSAWKYISAPADADSVLAVGAVNRLMMYASFSSVGPSSDGRIKPDVAAMGSGSIIGNTSDGITSGSGTSFSSPILAGMVAGFWQAFPYLSAMQVVETIRKAGSQATKPDNILGYGIPTFERASAIAPKPLGVENELKSGFRIFPNPFSEGTNPIIEFDPSLEGQHFQASLLSATGQPLWASEIQGIRGALPLGNMHLLPGFYLLNLQNEKNNQSLKVLKNEP